MEVTSTFINKKVKTLQIPKESLMTSLNVYCLILFLVFYQMMQTVYRCGK